MVLELSTNLCPIVDVGLYQSRLSPDHMFDRDDDEVLCSKVVTEAEKDYFFNKIGFCFDIEKYKKLIVKYVAAEIEDYFNDIRDLLIVKRCGTVSINSPDYYNYRTDWLFFDIEIDEAEIQKIRDAVNDDEQFFSWADRYKSYPGFISSMPHTKEKYICAINGKDMDRAVAMYITYIGEKHGFLPNKNEDSSYQSFLLEKISENNSYDEFINDERCLEILSKLRTAS